MGFAVGDADGDALGTALGDSDGDTLGTALGDPEGCTVGEPDGVLYLRCPEDTMILRTIAQNADGAAGRRDSRNMSVLARIDNHNENARAILQRYDPVVHYVNTSGDLDESYTGMGGIRDALLSIKNGDVERLHHAKVNSFHLW